MDAWEVCKMGKRWIFLLLAVFLVAGLLVGCGETTTPERVESDGSDEAAPVQAEVFAVGETVKMGDLSITVNAVREDSGVDFIKPKDGYIYYIVDCTLENHGGESEAISSLMMFSLADNEGYNHTVAIGPETQGSLDGELAPGRKMRGEVAFEIPADAAGLELVFEPNVFGFGQAIFALDR